MTAEVCATSDIRDICFDTDQLDEMKGLDFGGRVYKHHHHHSSQQNEATRLAVANLNALRQRTLNGESVQRELMLAIEALFHLCPATALQHLKTMQDLLQKNAELCNYVYQLHMAIQHGQVIPVPGGKGVIIRPPNSIKQ